VNNNSLHRELGPPVVETNNTNHMHTYHEEMEDGQAARKAQSELSSSEKHAE